MSIKNGIISVEALLCKKDLVIPEYQRPYKWNVKNVNQLMDDIIHHSEKSAYRLGTVVFHEADTEYNIVDGQQRTITLVLIALAISENERLTNLLHRENLKPLHSPLFDRLEFSNSVSQKNIHHNYREIKRRVNDFCFDTIHFFYKKCQLVEVVLHDISEAFQFFDSQNARGKDLEPHDLLKAFHLREMMNCSTEEERKGTVAEWENINTENLKRLFSNYLYRIRNWVKGNSARVFTKNDVHVFKGVTSGIQENFPYAKLYRIGHFYVEAYNSDYNRKIDQSSMDFPFQIDQVMINGNRFFEFIECYKSRVDSLQSKIESSDRGVALSAKIMNTLDSYEGRNRTGDKYVKNLFLCALLYYMDKFGNKDLDRAIEKLFFWAYRLRLSQQSVYLASVDNYALGHPHIFKRIGDALQPRDVLSIEINAIDKPVSSKTEALNKIFKQAGYLYE